MRRRGASEPLRRSKAVNEGGGRALELQRKETGKDIKGRIKKKGNERGKGLSGNVRVQERALQYQSSVPRRDTKRGRASERGAELIAHPETPSRRRRT